jgi:hypothetical protein
MLPVAGNWRSQLSTALVLANPTGTTAMPRSRGRDTPGKREGGSGGPGAKLRAGLGAHRAREDDPGNVREGLTDRPAGGDATPDLKQRRTHYAVSGVTGNSAASRLAVRSWTRTRNEVMCIASSSGTPTVGMIASGRSAFRVAVGVT